MEGNGNTNWTEIDNDCSLKQLKSGLQRNRRRVNVLSGRTEPGTDSARVSPSLMVRMVLGMAHAWRSHSPIHEKDAEQ